MSDVPTCGKDDGPNGGRGDGGARIRQVARNAAGQLVVHLADRDEPVEDARLARYFPWSLPDTYISIRDADEREVAMLKTLAELDDESRRVVEDELRDKIFNPKIRRVLNYKHEFGISSVTAETDRGKVVFQFRGREDIRHLSATRALFRDVDGNTYELSDLSRLDPASRKHLQHYF